MKLEAKQRLLSGLNPGPLLRVWTSNSVRRASGKTRDEILTAANRLAKIPGQDFPSTAYRLIDIDTTKVKDWGSLVKFLDAKFPEAFAGTLRALKAFEREAAGGHFPLARAGQLAFMCNVPLNHWMFSLPSLAKTLAAAELNKRDAAGFSIKEYLSQQEVVAQPGTLRKCISSGNAYLLGYSIGTSPFTWLDTPKRIVL